MRIIMLNKTVCDRELLAYINNKLVVIKSYKYTDFTPQVFTDSADKPSVECEPLGHNED